MSTHLDNFCDTCEADPCMCDHDCAFPSEPKDGEEFACYECHTLWEWIDAANTWEATGEATVEEGDGNAG